MMQQHHSTTDVTGKEKLPATEVRIETSVEDMGTVHIEQMELAPSRAKRST